MDTAAADKLTMHQLQPPELVWLATSCDAQSCQASTTKDAAYAAILSVAVCVTRHPLDAAIVHRYTFCIGIAYCI